MSAHDEDERASQAWCMGKKHTDTLKSENLFGFKMTTAAFLHWRNESSEPCREFV